ncbi:MAG: hypothetical protein V8R63_00305 [Thomasclavelia ramosa]
MIDNYEMLCCPANLVIASRVKDLASSYKNNLISVEQLEEYIQISALTVDEIIYLYYDYCFQVNLCSWQSMMIVMMHK